MDQVPTDNVGSEGSDQRVDPPPPKYRDPLNIMRGRSDSKFNALEGLGWLNPVTVVAAIAVGISKVIGRFAGRHKR